MKISTFFLLREILLRLYLMFKHLCLCTRIIKDTVLDLEVSYLVQIIVFYRK